MCSRHIGFFLWHMFGTEFLFYSQYIYSFLAGWLTLVRQPTQRRCTTAFCRGCWMDITLAMWDTNAKTQFKAQVPSMTVPQFALPGSAKVSGYFITGVVSTALWKYWPILQLQENEAQREEKLAYAARGESSSNTMYGFNGDQTQQGTLGAGQRYVIPASPAVAASD